MVNADASIVLEDQKKVIQKSEMSSLARIKTRDERAGLVGKTTLRKQEIHGDREEITPSLSWAALKIANDLLYFQISIVRMIAGM